MFFTTEQIWFRGTMRGSKFVGASPISNPTISMKIPNKIIFITGTDTGSGKTLLTAHLLHHLRSSGVNALALKPFCSGGLDDANLLNSLQNQALSQSEITPFYFAEPVAPLAAARKTRQKIRLPAVLTSIKRIKKRCDILLVEGSGGILVPLGENFSVRDLIVRLGCPVIVAAQNRLGVINQTRLTVESLQIHGVKRIKVVLMGVKNPDISVKNNAKLLSELLKSTPVFELPYLGKNADSTSSVKKDSKKFKKGIALKRGFGNLSVF